MRHTCITCGETVSSWRHTATNTEGHGINPLCDRCATAEADLDKQEPGVYVAPVLGINYVPPGPSSAA